MTPPHFQIGQEVEIVGPAEYGYEKFVRERFKIESYHKEAPVFGGRDLYSARGVPWYPASLQFFSSWSSYWFCCIIYYKAVQRVAVIGMITKDCAACPDLKTEYVANLWWYCKHDHGHASANAMLKPGGRKCIRK
jgi:hypothetical protein